MSFYSEGFKLGILGGGQLGRMFIQEAVNFDLSVHILDPNPEAPCSKIAHSFTCGAFTDYDTVMAFGKDLDVLTIEIENVNTQALKDLSEAGVRVFPQADVIETIKDKGKQKLFYRMNSIPTAAFHLVESENEIGESDLPCIQKLRVGGYDGRGVKVLRTKEDLKDLLPGPSVVEELIDIEKEISVIVARNERGETRSFPAVELEFHPVANLVEFLKCPADISIELQKKAEELAVACIEKFELIGILGVEIFLTKTGDIIINEVAPRTHNSGHQSIEGNNCSQFEQHLRSVLNLPLGDPRITEPSVMINVLGEPGFEGPVYYEGLEDALKMPGVHPHIYGKKITKPYRKMGHITVTADSIEAATQTAQELKEIIKVKSQ